MRNTESAKLDGLVGEWTTTRSDAWFLEPPGTEVSGTTTIEWLWESRPARSPDVDSLWSFWRPQ